MGLRMAGVRQSLLTVNPGIDKAIETGIDSEIEARFKLERAILLIQNGGQYRWQTS